MQNKWEPGNVVSLPPALSAGDDAVVSLGWPAIRALAAWWVFPGLVVAMVVGNQLWMIGPVYVGQAISWAVDLAAAAVVLGTFRHKAWPLVLLACIISAKASGIVLAASPKATLAYDISLNALFCAAGAVMATRRPALLYRQVLAICVVSLPFMILQVTGVGEWTQFLATEAGPGPKPQYPTLFVPENYLMFSVIQGQPSGLLHSNNFLSLIVVFAFGLHLSRARTSRIGAADVALVAMVVLAMAKIVFLVCGVMLLWLMFVGRRWQRVKVVKLMLLTATLFWGYAQLFPGLVAIQMSWYSIVYSFFIRANNLVSLLGDVRVVATELAPLLEDTPTATWDLESNLSGYAQVVKVLPFFLAGLVIAAPLFVRGLRRLRVRYPQLTVQTTLTFFVVALYPAAVPFFEAQLYWFIAGFALLPVFIVLQPRYFAGSVPASAHGAGT